jgi:uracil-DNA glycosylase
MNPAATALAGLPLAAATFAEWREAARELLAHGIAPPAVAWCEPGAFSGAPAPARRTHNAAVQLQEPKPVPHLPRSLMELLQAAACCRAPDRWAFLYRVVWRWQLGEHEVQSARDADGARLHAMVRAVRREEHEMQATIRFRERPAEAGPPRFVAWCETRHDVLAQVAQHFVSRMGRVSWMIATPEASVLWDGATLHNCGPLVASGAELDGPGEAPWLAYYRGVYGARRGYLPLLRSYAPLPGWRRLPEPAPCAPCGGVQAVARKPPAAPVTPVTPAGAAEQGQHPASLEECRRCGLWEHATQAVGGEGPRRARIMLVGEQPGDQEDLAGQPFVGPAGKLLDRVCEQAGLDRRKIYLTNAVKHFKWEPRGKRRLHKTPAQREIEACGYWLDKEMAQVRPAVIVAMGSTALKAVLDNAHATLKDTLGHPIRHQGRWVVAIYHPSYALRVPSEEARHEAFASMVAGLRLAQQLLERPDAPEPP